MLQFSCMILGLLGMPFLNVDRDRQVLYKSSQESGCNLPGVGITYVRRDLGL